ncbi:hypothetical protein [Klebsiella pneumoniae]
MSESAWEEMTCLFAPSLRENKKGDFRILKSPGRIKVDTLKIC